MPTGSLYGQLESFRHDNGMVPLRRENTYTVLWWGLRIIKQSVLIDIPYYKSRSKHLRCQLARTSVNHGNYMLATKLTTA